VCIISYTFLTLGDIGIKVVNQTVENTPLVMPEVFEVPLEDVHPVAFSVRLFTADYLDN